MNKNMKKVIAFLVTVGSLLTMCIIPVFAYDETYLDLRISGRGGDYSYFQNANWDNGDWHVDLDPDYDRPEVVLRAWLQNSEYVNRGYMEIYEGTSNTSSSDCTEGYDYRIFGKREKLYDGYVTVQGHWYLNY